MKEIACDEWDIDQKDVLNEAFSKIQFNFNFMHRNSVYKTHLDS